MFGNVGREKFQIDDVMLLGSMNVVPRGTNHTNGESGFLF